MRVHDLNLSLSQLGAAPVHAATIRRAWLAGKPLGHTPKRQAAEHVYPLRLREGLAELGNRLDGLVRLETEHPAADGSSRLLLRLQDGQLIESVLLPRDGVCVSTQVGCAVGCLFCMTGKSGLLRQLTSLEIMAQVVLARRMRPVKKVVFMGMGEPAHNLENVLEAIDLLGREGQFGHKNLVFSTVGDARVFAQLPQQSVKPALALSLHTTKAELRQQLLPKAPAIAPNVLMEEAEKYARLTGYPIQVQWTLLAGVNDGDDELDAIVELFRGKYAVLNVIPFNSAEGDDYQRPDGDRIIHIVRYLHRHGVLTKVRNSAGQEVDGGCGQLRARASENPDVVRWRNKPLKLNA